MEAKREEKSGFKSKTALGVFHHSKIPIPKAARQGFGEQLAEGVRQTCLSLRAVGTALLPVAGALQIAAGH